MIICTKALCTSFTNVKSITWMGVIKIIFIDNLTQLCGSDFMKSSWLMSHFSQLWKKLNGVGVWRNPLQTIHGLWGWMVSGNSSPMYSHSCFPALLKCNLWKCFQLSNSTISWKNISAHTILSIKGCGWIYPRLQQHSPFIHFPEIIQNQQGELDGTCLLLTLKLQWNTYPLRETQIQQINPWSTRREYSMTSARRCYFISPVIYMELFWHRLGKGLIVPTLNSLTITNLKGHNWVKPLGSVSLNNYSFVKQNTSWQGLGGVTVYGWKHNAWS